MYGTLNDLEIEQFVKEGKLISEDFDKKNIKQACYELRAGNCYYDLNSGEERHSVADGEIILIKPHQRIVILTKEKLQIPQDVLARVLSKGSLFSLGIVPVNTYADPGFVGRMGIVMQNLSNNYLKITSGDPIAKIEFDRLQSPVKNIYHGQHGYETGIWPIRHDQIVKNKGELKKYLGNYNEIDQIRDTLGIPVANIIERVLITERRFLIATILYIIITLIIMGVGAGADWLSPVTSVFIGIVTNIIYAIGVFFVSNYKRKINGKYSFKKD